MAWRGRRLTAARADAKLAKLHKFLGELLPLLCQAVSRRSLAYIEKLYTNPILMLDS